MATFTVTSNAVVDAPTTTYTYTGGDCEDAVSALDGLRAHCVALETQAHDARVRLAEATRVAALLTPSRARVEKAWVRGDDVVTAMKLATKTKTGSVCRICLNGDEETGKPLVPLGCACRGGLELAHERCAVQWFRTRTYGRASGRATDEQWNVEWTAKCEVCDENVSSKLVAGVLKAERRAATTDRDPHTFVDPVVALSVDEEAPSVDVYGRQHTYVVESELTIARARSASDKYADWSVKATWALVATSLVLAVLTVMVVVAYFA